MEFEGRGCQTAGDIVGLFDVFPQELVQNCRPAYITPELKANKKSILPVSNSLILSKIINLCIIMIEIQEAWKTE